MAIIGGGTTLHKCSTEERVLPSHHRREIASTGGLVCIVLLTTTAKMANFFVNDKVIRQSLFLALFKGSWLTILFPAQEPGNKLHQEQHTIRQMLLLATIRVDADNSLIGQMVEPVQALGQFNMRLTTHCNHWQHDWKATWAYCSSQALLTIQHDISVAQWNTFYLGLWGNYITVLWI